METNQTGTLVLTTLPEGKEREPAVQFLLGLFKNVPQEKVLGLLQKMPFVLGKDVPASKAQKVIAELKKRGADAAFLPHTPTEPQSASRQKLQSPHTQQVQKPYPSARLSLTTGKKKPTQTKNFQASILGAFRGKLPRGKASFLYQLGLFLVAFAMLLLPLVYLGLIGGVGYGLCRYAVEGLEFAKEAGNARSAFFVYVAPLAIGGLLLLFMVKPLFVKQAERFKPRRILRQDEPSLFAFVEKICEVVGAPVPQEIQVDTEVNASASLQHGIWSILSRDLVLTIGLPLTAGLDLQQFAGVLAHEFGHFSQTTGMRFSFLIRTINYWFERVVYQEDAWDWRIRQWSRQWDLRIALVLWIARFFIWLTRQILKGLMYIGHAMSCFMSRQMEYDADRYEIHLAGADVFEETFERITMLSIAEQRMFHSLNEQWEEGRLVDNVAALVLSHEKQIPEKVRQQVKSSEKKARTGFFDTHPSHADRIAASRKITSEKAFCVDPSDPSIQEKLQQCQKNSSTATLGSVPPASILFRDFERFARNVSLDFYRSALQQRITANQLVSVNDLLENQDQEDDFFQALDGFFQGQYSVLRPLELEKKLASQAPDNPREIVRRLKQLRQTIRNAKDEQARLLKTFRKQEGRLVTIACAQALSNAGFRFAPKDFDLPSSEPAAIDKAYRNTLKSQKRLMEKLYPFEQAVRERISGALGLLLIPKVLGRLTGGERLQQETERYLKALKAIELQFPECHELYYRTQQLTILARQIEGNEQNKRLISQLHTTMEMTHDLLGKIQLDLAQIAYPFEHAKANITIGMFLLGHIPEKDNLRGLLDTSYSALDRQQRLAARLAARIVHTVEQIETLVGLPPLPRSPSE